LSASFISGNDDADDDDMLFSDDVDKLVVVSNRPNEGLQNIMIWRRRNSSKPEKYSDLV
jgi:hypothetical protein